MLAAFPLTTARDRRWGCQTHQQVSSQDHSKKGQWTCHTHQWSQLPLVISGNCFGGHDIFGIHWSTAWCYGMVRLGLYSLNMCADFCLFAVYFFFYFVLYVYIFINSTCSRLFLVLSCWVMFFSGVFHRWFNYHSHGDQPISIEYLYHY